MSFLSEAKYQRFAILLVLIFFTLATFIITYPLLMKFNHSIYAEIDDNLGVLWALWWIPHAVFELGISPMHSPYIEAPFGLNLSFPAALNYIISLPLSQFFNNITVFNIIEVSGFILSGLGMYLLVYFLTRSFIAGLISGIIYAFSPYHVGYTKHMLDLSQIQWFPFYLYFLLKVDLWCDKYRIYLRNLFFCVFFFLLTALTNAYYTVMLLLITFIYMFVRVFPRLVLWYQRTFPPFKKIISDTLSERTGFLKIILFGLVTGLILLFLFKGLRLDMDYIKLAVVLAVILFAFKLMFIYKNLRLELDKVFRRNLVKVISITAGLVVAALAGIFIFNTWFRDLWQTVIYPLHMYKMFVLRLIPGHFLIPPFQHPVLGTITSRFFPNFTPWDMCQYIGWSVLILSMMGFLLWNKKDARQKTVMLYFVLCLLVVAGLGTIPVMRLFGSNVYMPAYYLHRLFPFFRDMKRLAVIIMLALAVLAGFGVSNMLKIITGRSKKAVFLSIFILLISIEYFPRPLNVDLGKTPEVYKWLKSQEGDFVIAEYPFYDILDVRRNEFMFFQTIHQKKVINVPRRGSAQSQEADKFIRRATKDIHLMPKNSITALKLLGVKYVLFRNDRIGFKPHFDADSGLSLLKSFEDTDVYTIQVPKADFIVDIQEEDMQGFYATLYNEDGKPTKWMRRDAYIGLSNLTTEPLEVDFYFTTRSLKEKHRIKVKFNGQIIKEFDVFPEEKSYEIKNLVLLPKGRDNIIELHDTAEVLETLGERKISIGITSVEFKPKEE